MIVFLNGQFVPEEQAVVSVFDRGFLYGDGLFEVVRIHQGAPFRWRDHFLRLEQGARLLNIALPCSAEQLCESIDQLVQRNRMPEALLRLTLSRGVGPRGYSPRGADRPTLAMTLHPAPDAAGQPRPKWRVQVASFRLPANEPLARFKTCNKLAQVLARAEAEAAGADEALLLNTLGEVVEASSGNLFWIENGVVCTPPLASGILAGVTRIVVFELCDKLGLPTRETSITPKDLVRAEAVFLSLSSWGIIEVATLNQKPLNESPLVKTIQQAYAAAMTVQDT
jgi:branched-chain amino acid aminotransferase